ncbi:MULTISPECIES: WG repeat-containing protein [unclassified Acidovorax]|uniref:WG repeat-containing protein n=1 Tax=unclassified Acidovorax TaxID=2684926 RepID=UPI0028831B93|nr:MULTISPECIES: WG repeat-containing protein [unclassified Acidovorax]
MNDHTHAPPRLVRIPLQADDQAHALLIVQGDRAIEPTGGLCQVLRFVPDGAGGWIAAAQAGDERWGYIDGEGAWRVPPTLDNARSFSSDGVARFCDQGLWGYLDTAGRVLITPRFDDARPMRGGLAAVKTGNAAWRIVRQDGEFACDAVFEDLGPFGAQGLARASQHGAMGYVDAAGQWVIAPRLRHARDFEDQAVVPASMDGHSYGLLDACGTWVLPPRYPRLEAFNEEGMAFFAEPDAARDGHGYIDTQGRVVLHGGPHLSRHMACGLAADHSDDEGTRYRVAQRALPADEGQAAAASDRHASAYWSYGTAFRAGGCMAVVRRAPKPLQEEGARGMGLATQGAAHGAWGLLHADGRFVPAPAGLLEPLTGAEGWLPPPQPGTALVAFHTNEGQLAWVDGDGAVAWRAHYDGQQAALLDAQGRLLWHSAPRDNCWPPRPFFHAPLVDLLQGITGVDQVATLACTLAATAERRLHALAAGQFRTDEAELSDTVRSADIDPSITGDDADRRATVAVRRVLRATLGEAHQATYAFLAPERERMLREGRRVLAQHLGQRHGTPDQQPDHAAPQTFEGEDLLAWPLPLAQPVAAGDPHTTQNGTRQLWLSLYARRSAQGTPPGDGDAWWELWLMVAPSTAALQAAQSARNAIHARNRPADRHAPRSNPAPSRAEELSVAATAVAAPPRIVLPSLSTLSLNGAAPPAKPRPAVPAPAFHAMAAQLSLRPARAPQQQHPQHRRWATPAVALMAHFVLSVLAIACHAGVVLAAWREEGLWAGLGTLVFMGFAELYWAWRFAFHTPESLALAAAALAVVLYLFVWCVVYRRMGQTFTAQGATA